MEKWQAAKGAQFEVAKKRLEDEKDPVIRSFLAKGIAQSGAEMQREHREANDKLIQQEHEMFHRNLQRIMDEIARYAKEHKILVVRRVPNPGDTGAGVVPPPVPDFPTGTLGAPPVLPPARTPADATAPPQTAIGVPTAPPAIVAAPLADVPAPITPPQVASVSKTKSNSLRGPWDQEVLYVAKVHGEVIPDISDEIVKRLNAADEAKDKAANATRK